VFRTYSIGGRTLAEWNYGGDRQIDSYTLDGTVAWLNFWTNEVSLRIDRRTQDFGLTRGGTSMQRPKRWELAVQLRNNPADRTRWSADASYGRNEDGGLKFNLEAAVAVRPQPRWELSISPEFTRDLSTQQYVANLKRTGISTFGRRLIFAHVDRSEIVMQTRLNYTFKPDLTVEVYAEPFAASGRFFNYGELAVPRTREIRRYNFDGTAVETLDNGTLRVKDGDELFELSNRDFNVLSFRSNMVFRWEWQPGSTLFLVWQQDRSKNTPIGARVNAGDLFQSIASPGSNSLMIKASFWLPIG
jgi:hypothetical protein